MFITFDYKKRRYLTAKVRLTEVFMKWSPSVYLPLTSKNSVTFTDPFIHRVLKGLCSSRGGNWGTLKIPREDWRTLGNIREDKANDHPPLRILFFTVHFETGHHILPNVDLKNQKKPGNFLRVLFWNVLFFLRSWGKNLGFSDIAHFNLYWK